MSVPPDAIFSHSTNISDTAQCYLVLMCSIASCHKDVSDNIISSISEQGLHSENISALQNRLIV
jgi:hypothetical protein